MSWINNILKLILGYFTSNSKAESVIPRFVPTQKLFLGKTLFIHDISSYHLGEYEIFKNETYKFKAKQQVPKIIDCGANLGMSIIYFKQLYPNSIISAFEPDPYIFSFLSKNIESFEYKNVDLFQKAIWINEGTLSFMEDGGAGGRLQQVIEGDEHKYSEVPSARLRDYLGEDKIDFLKLDIEGAEYEVLKDCADSLNNVDHIFIEYHSFSAQDQNLDKILQIIANAGFRYHLKEALPIEHPFLSRPVSNGMDSQINIYCFRN